MKIVQINATFKHGSTGKIMSDLNDIIQKKGYESYMVAGYDYGNYADNLYIMHTLPASLNVRMNLLFSRITGVMGYRQKVATIKMIEYLRKIRPDIIHLHNIHGDYINLKILFEYIKVAHIPIVWTLHDCWSFTGRCSHFEQVGCMKWKTGCYKCANRKVYPIVYGLDFSKKMWRDKKSLFTGLEKAFIITPSKWLANYVKQSYMKNYPIKVINNGIDTEMFYPVDTVWQDRKKIILGVASMWTKNKGLEDFYVLSQLLDLTKYQLVLIGLNKVQLKNAPKEVLALGRTKDINELIKWYSVASIYVNLTYLDTFPTTNIEALACGTPVITYKTGGSVESVNESVGAIVEQGDIQGVYQQIIRICEKENGNYTDKCRQIAVNRFNKYDRFQEYLEIYERLIK